ncbi:MAG TPA: 6,7-dimethyl-8-ribityllumazine synthase [Balneolaceae bacterium]|nr:6,7-dimethyl-8-ribityllumazine synthase [Balneolaceae bacterium]
MQIPKAEVNWSTITVAVVAAKWNSFITDKMAEGAIDALRSKGIPEKQIVLLRCPGAYELPLASKKCIEYLNADAVVAIGAVIRGGTPHFDYVCDAVNRGITDISIATGTPVAFGVLTTDNVEQAVERANTGKGNKGAEAALAACDMIELEHSLKELSKDF